MPSIDIKIHSDTKNLDKVIKLGPERNRQSVDDAAEALKQDIRTSWSPSSPSAPGRPPAVVSGELDKSIYIEEVRTAGWLTVRAVRVRAGHWIFLEFGTTVNMKARPFLRPAAFRQRKHLGNRFKVIFTP